MFKKLKLCAFVLISSAGAMKENTPSEDTFFLIPADLEQDGAQKNKSTRDWPEWVQKACYINIEYDKSEQKVLIGDDTSVFDIIVALTPKVGGLTPLLILDCKPIYKMMLFEQYGPNLNYGTNIKDTMSKYKTDRFRLFRKK
jgi:hypothetical protein